MNFLLNSSVNLPFLPIYRHAELMPTVDGVAVAHRARLPLWLLLLAAGTTLAVLTATQRPLSASLEILRLHRVTLPTAHLLRFNEMFS